MSYIERVFLSDNNLYLLDDKCVVETVCDARHGDWKSSYTPTPKGTQLEVIEVWRNFYGVWVRVLYDGFYYDLHPRNLKYIGRETI